MFHRIYYWLRGCRWRLTVYIKPGVLTAEDIKWALKMLGTDKARGL